MHNSPRAERPERTIGNPLSGVASIRAAVVMVEAATPVGRGIGGVVGTAAYSSGGGGGIGKFTPN